MVTVPQSQILPTNTTCSQFSSGTAQSLLTINYTVSGGTIAKSINPGVFFYYTNVTAPNPASPFVISIDQSTTNTAAGDTELFTSSPSQVQLYNADCTTSNLSFTVDFSNPAKYTITVSGATAGQKFILSVKYSTKSIAGDPAPTPDNPVYTFDTDVNNVVQPGTSASVTLTKT